MFCVGEPVLTSYNTNGRNQLINPQITAERTFQKLHLIIHILRFRQELLSKVT